MGLDRPKGTSTYNSGNVVRASGLHRTSCLLRAGLDPMLLRRHRTSKLKLGQIDDDEWSSGVLSYLRRKSVAPGQRDAKILVEIAKSNTDQTRTRIEHGR